MLVLNLAVFVQVRIDAEHFSHMLKLFSACAPGCARWFIRNGLCEHACNNTDCQFDGGDCWGMDGYVLH